MRTRWHLYRGYFKQLWKNWLLQHRKANVPAGFKPTKVGKVLPLWCCYLQALGDVRKAIGNHVCLRAFSFPPGRQVVGLKDGVGGRGRSLAGYWKCTYTQTHTHTHEHREREHRCLMDVDWLVISQGELGGVHATGLDGHQVKYSLTQTQGSLYIWTQI